MSSQSNVLSMEAFREGKEPSRGLCFSPAEDWARPVHVERWVEQTASHAKLRSRLHSFRLDFPHLLGALHRLADFATPNLVLDGRCLVGHVVSTVLDVYQECVMVELDDPEIEILRAISAASSQLAAIRVVGRTTAGVLATWCYQEALPEWIAREEIKAIALGRRAEIGASTAIGLRVHLLSRLVDADVLARYLDGDQRLRWAAL